VLNVAKAFVEAGGDSFWAYQVHYDTGEKPGSGTDPGAVARKKPMVDYKEVLAPEDFTLFLRLKEWRKARAGEDSVEAYTIFTNAQLAEIAQRRPGTPEALKEIPGIGEGRIEKHGTAVLELVKGEPSEGDGSSIAKEAEPE